MWNANAINLYLGDNNGFLQSYCENNTLDGLRLHFGAHEINDGNALPYLNRLRSILSALVVSMPNSIHGTPRWNWPKRARPLVVMSTIKHIKTGDHIFLDGNDRLTVCFYEQNFYLGFGIKGDQLKLVNKYPELNTILDLPLLTVENLNAAGNELHPSQKYVLLEENIGQPLSNVLQQINHLVYDRPNNIFTPHGVITPRFIQDAANQLIDIHNPAQLDN